jgi:hypothetical protein
MISIVSTSFAIPAKPFRILINKDYKLIDTKSFDDVKKIEPTKIFKPVETFRTVVSEPIKIINNSKIYLKATINESFKAQLTWVTAVGHHAKSYIIQISNDKENFYDLKEITVEVLTDDRFIYTYSHNHTNFGTRYYRIVERSDDEKMIFYAPVAITLEAIPAPTEMVKCLQSEENNIIHIKTGDSRLIPILTTETGMGIPCDYKYSEATQTGILKPLYYLAGGNYHLKVRLGNNESKYIVSVDDLDGMTF